MLIRILGVIVKITELDFSPKFMIGLLLVMSAGALGVGIYQIQGSKSPEEYLGAFIYAIAFFAFGAMMWWMDNCAPSERE